MISCSFKKQYVILAVSLTVAKKRIFVKNVLETQLFIQNQVLGSFVTSHKLMKSPENSDHNFFQGSFSINQQKMPQKKSLL